jgi:PAS domain S-box-containing protein
MSEESKTSMGLTPNLGQDSSGQKKSAIPANEIEHLPASELRRQLLELEQRQAALETQNQKLRSTTLELEATAAKYHDLYQHSPFGYVTVDTNCIIQEVNTKAEHLFGAPQEQITNCSLCDFIHQESQAAFNHFFQKILLSPAPQTVEVQVLSCKGSLLYAQLEGNQLSFDSAPTQCRIAFVDVTERKTAHLGVSNKEALLSAIINSSLNAIQVLKAVRDQAGKLIDFDWVLLNRTAELFLDQTLGQLRKQRLSEVLPEMVHAGYFHTLENVLQDNKPATFTAQLTIHQQTHWLNCVATKLEDGLVLTSEDVTQQRISHDKLQESQLLVKKMAEAMPDFLYIEDLEAGRNVYNNRNFLSFLGFAAQDIKGHPRDLLDTLYHPEDEHLLFNRAKRFAQVDEGSVLEYVVRIKDKESTWRHIQFRETVFKRSATGMPVQLVGTAQDITEKKRAEQELQRLHKTISAILENLPVIIWRLDSEGHIIESVGSGLTSLGYKDHELEGKLISEVNPSIVPNINQVLKGHSDFFIAESEINGKKRYKQNYFVHDKSTNGGIGFCLDITDQKTAEAEAQYRNLLLDQLLQNLPLVLAVVDKEARYLEIRGNGLKAVGLQDNELKGKLVYDVFPVLKDNFSEILSGEVKSFTAAFPYQGKNSYFKNYGFLEKQNQIGIAFGIDITDLHEAQEKLIQEKEFSENLLETHINGIIAFDKFLHVTAWNKAMEQITSLPREQVLGKPAQSFLTKSKPGSLLQNLKRVLEGAQVTIKQLPFLPQNRSFEVNLAPLFGSNKEVVGVLGIVWDVTAQKAKQQAETQYELSQQKAVMEAVLTTQNEERKRIAEALHNSLAQLLYAAKLHLEELQTKSTIDVNLTEPVSKLSGFLEEAIKETRTLAHELIPRVLQDFGLKSALKDLATRLTSKNLSIQCVVTGFNQPKDYALETHIFRFVQELLNNVMKHAQATEALVQVVDKGNAVRVRVEDNGKGLSTQELDKPASKGMGLKTLKDRLTLLQGELTVTSSKNEGTIITIEIPTK